jgi:hypothetical protein
MALADLTREAVFVALHEFDDVGRDAFTARSQGTVAVRC